MKSHEKHGRRDDRRQSGNRRILPYAIPLCVTAAFLVDSPALRGPFVFDDFNLPYYKALVEGAATSWFNGVRPLLMASFRLNYEWSGQETFSYHLLNLVFHLLNSGLIGLITWKLLANLPAEAWRRQLASVSAGALFLLHPVQTESVAYIASRSENLSGLFFFGALALYLYRPHPAIGWSRAIAILALYGAAASTKENTVVLPVILAAADVWFRRDEGPRAAVSRNWRLYLPLLAAAGVTTVLVLRLVSTSLSAGFRIAGPFAYFWTESRMLLTYLLLCIFPFRQTIDYDVRWAQSPFEPGTLAGLATLAALLIFAWRKRERYPVATFGITVFLLVLAPTSSFIPLADPIAEHRLYLPMLGAALIAAEVAARSTLSRASLTTATAAVAVIASAASYNRSRVWGSEAALWEDAIAKAPDKQRDYAHLVHGLIREHQCRSALAFLDDLERRGKVDPTLLEHWSYALECVEDFDGAGDKLEEAVRAQPTPDRYIRLAVLRTRRGRVGDALGWLNRAIGIRPDLEAARALRGDLQWARGDMDAAAEDYRQVIELNPGNQVARQRLDQIEEVQRLLRMARARGRARPEQP